MQRLFLDTNIVLDFLGERQKFYIPSAQLLTLADKKAIEIYTSPTAISTVYYILSKYENSINALEKIRKFKLICSMSKMNDEVIEKAIHSDFKDFEDAIQYFSALATPCDLIISRNEKDFKIALIPIMNANSFLKTFGF